MNGLLRDEVFELISAERETQEEEYDFSVPEEIMLTVLTEEVGEVARAILEKDQEALQAELVQVAAVCCKWLEHSPLPQVDWRQFR